MSDSEAAKEIVDEARNQGRSISKVPGKRIPTERYVDGKGWVRV